ncbi:MAG: dephospho-CoA kinase [Actinomycetota bacterium]|jgi:dephospho-CoA kinase|nr:dephospho-CoA kinase [Actinomycetota bacterium]
MLLVGLTGGIGAGKSTFAALLAERGAVIIDADKLGHEVLAPGEPAWHSVVDQFGDEILSAGSMDIDRKVLARIVFSDPAKLTALNAITHPAIMRKIADKLETLRGTDQIVVLDAALIVELGLAGSIDVTIVVASDTEIRRARLISDRGMTAQGVDERIAAQARPEELIAKADIVVTNNGALEALGNEADRVWAELEGRRT